MFGGKVLINNWHVPRNKRKLYPIVDLLSVFALQNLGDVWSHDLGRQLDFEAEIERQGLKRPGPRRNQLAGGARTYEAWLYCLGLTYIESESGLSRLTMAGDALINGQPPVQIMTNQLMKFQYPSPYSLRLGVRIDPRFRIRPFRFILRLLANARIRTLSNAEIARFVITEAENETQQCFDHVLQRILNHRDHGDGILPDNLADLYPSSKNNRPRSYDATILALEHNANTFINYLEYTQLITRDTPRSPIYIPQARMQQVQSMLQDGSSIRPLNQTNAFWKENFQRNYGLLPGQTRDNRNFNQQGVNGNVIVERLVRNEFFQVARTQFITGITPQLISQISNTVGVPQNRVEEILDLLQIEPISVFETSFVDMAFSGRELATQFETSTVDVFQMLGFDATHVGASPRQPDIFVESPLHYSGIIDNKAYHEFSITHDYELKMKNTYIPTYLRNTSNLTFFMYIAGGFGQNINQQVQGIAQETGVSGCVIKASDLMRLLRKHQQHPINHHAMLNLFTANRRITIADIEAL
jgi:hypothetical protein